MSIPITITPLWISLKEQVVVYDIELKTRVGDLSGVAGSRNALGFTGFGIMSEVVLLIRF